VLGLANTFIAFIIYYSLIDTIGATHTSMITYAIPVVGVTLGFLVLGDEVNLTFLIGGFLTLLSLMLANSWRVSSQIFLQGDEGKL